MDAWGQIGPEKPDFGADIVAIAAHLRAGRAVEVRHAHRNTQTRLVLSPRAAVVDYGDVSPAAARPLLARQARYTVLVTATGKGGDWLPLVGDVHWTGVSQYFGLRNQVDATAIADFLNLLSPLLAEPTGHRPECIWSGVPVTECGYCTTEPPARTPDGTTEVLAQIQGEGR